MVINMNNQQRKLLIVPILHSREDMGSLGSRLPAGKAGLPSGDGYSFMASSFWREVEEKVKRGVNDFKNVKVYQDGLPDTQEELVDKIINKVKSANYDLLRFLKNKGAKVLGTEDPELLIQEYQFVAQILNSQDEKSKRETKQAYENQEDKLLAKRDDYIAKQINKTLNQGELGILFIGAAHQIQDKLPKDIQIEIL